MAKYKQKFNKIIFYRIHHQNNNFQNKNHSKRALSKNNFKKIQIQFQIQAKPLQIQINNNPKD